MKKSEKEVFGKLVIRTVLELDIGDEIVKNKKENKITEEDYRQDMILSALKYRNDMIKIMQKILMSIIEEMETHGEGRKEEE